MKLVKVSAPGGHGWSAEPSDRWFAQPYPWREAVYWLAKNVTGPACDHADAVSPLERDFRLAPVAPTLTVAFVGDILPLGGRHMVPEDAVREFLAPASILVGNFEGTLIEGRAPRRFVGQAHTRATLEFLADLFPPERTILTCANNHVGEYGVRASLRSQQLLEASGFQVVGRADQPGILIDGQVLIAGGTTWLNRESGFVARLRDATELWTATPARFRILSPHWGYELEAYPRPSQVAEAGRLLQRWDAIVGHHSHWPQPVALHPGGSDAKVVAYSLGNFVFGRDYANHAHGAILRLTIGPRSDGRWAVGDGAWRPTRMRFFGSREAVVKVARGEA